MLQKLDCCPWVCRYREVLNQGKKVLKLMLQQPDCCPWVFRYREVLNRGKKGIKASATATWLLSLSLSLCKALNRRKKGIKTSATASWLLSSSLSLSRNVEPEKMLLNRTHKIAAVYEQICSRLDFFRLFFIHNFPHQRARNPSLFFYFYGAHPLSWCYPKSRLNFPPFLLPSFFSCFLPFLSMLLPSALLASPDERETSRQAGPHFCHVNNANQMENTVTDYYERLHRDHMSLFFSFRSKEDPQKCELPHFEALSVSSFRKY